MMRSSRSIIDVVVIAVAADQRVEVVAAVERVVAGAADEEVFAQPAVQRVVAGISEQKVKAAVAGDRVVAGGAGKRRVDTGIGIRCRSRFSA